MVIEPQETARRVRAARAYAGLTRQQLAEKANLTDRQLKRLEDGQRLSTSQEELFLLAEACGVPQEFMAVGFKGAEEMFARMTRIMAVVLSQNLPAILAEAEQYDVRFIVKQHGDAIPDLVANGATVEVKSQRGGAAQPQAEQSDA